MAKTSKILTKEALVFAEASLAKLGKKASEVNKLQVVISAGRNGITKTAEFFNISKTTLFKWIKSVSRGALEELNVGAGRGPKKKLSDEQEKAIKGWLEENSQMTINAVRLKILELWNVDLSLSTVHRLMKKLGFSYITARPRHYKQNVSALPEAKKKSSK